MRVEGDSKSRAYRRRANSSQRFVGTMTGHMAGHMVGHMAGHMKREPGR